MQKDVAPPLRAPGGGQNGEIQFYRLLMALSVALFHFAGDGGYLAVDFFFLLSGYFAVRRAVRHPQASYRDAMGWTLKKLAPTYAYVLPICGSHILVHALLEHRGFTGALRALVYEIPQLSLISASGLFDGSYNFVSHLWYLSCLFMLLPVFYALLIKNRDFFLYVFAPLSMLLCYGYCARAVGHLQLSHALTLFFIDGMFRAWAGLCGGALVWLLSEKLRRMPELTRAGRHLLSGAQLLCLAAALLYMRTDAGTTLDFLCVALFIAVVSIALSERASIHPLFQPLNRINSLSELSLALYLGHWTLPELLRVSGGGVPAGVYLILCVLYAALWVLIVRGLRALGLGRRLKNLLFA